VGLRITIFLGCYVCKEAAKSTTKKLVSKKEEW